MSSINTQNSPLNDNIRCPICMDKNGIIILTNCGHNVCGDCIFRIINSNQHRCPNCRVNITSKPVIMYAVVTNENTPEISSQINTWWTSSQSASTNLSTLSRHATHANTVQNIFNRLQNTGFGLQEGFGSGGGQSGEYQYYQTQINNNFPSLADLCLAAKEENCQVAFLDESIEKPWRIANNLLPSAYTSNQIHALNPSNTIHQLPNGWSFTPFTVGPFIIKYDVATLICRNQNSNNLHRRILIKSGMSIDFNPIILIENEIKDTYHDKELISELKIRGNDGLTLAAHMGTCAIPREELNINADRGHQVLNISIAARGVWFRNNTMGVRWHVVYVE